MLVKLKKYLQVYLDKYLTKKPLTFKLEVLLSYYSFSIRYQTNHLILHQ